MTEKFLKNKVELHCGDCLAVLPMLAENSIDACVCDPPYHLTSIVKRFGANGAAPAQFGTDGAYARASTGFMGRTWDGGDIAFRVETWREVYRVLKPGAHLVAFGGTRTFHRMACAIEDAGFEIRDTIMWLYGSGFPKSHDVSKGIDRAAGAKRDVVGKGTAGLANGASRDSGSHVVGFATEYDLTAPASLFSHTWEGWGTALKPACEPIVLARKPLSESTVAANVLRWGTGALNIDGCRIGVDGGTESTGEPNYKNEIYGRGMGGLEIVDGNKGRWPANIIHDGSDEVVGLFPDVNPGMSGGDIHSPNAKSGMFGKIDCAHTIRNDTGSAARFFYTSKADADDRLGSGHPTIKPLDLMQYLIRLVCPQKGTVVDPFAGTGTTGEAAWREGMGAVLIEREAEYQADIRRRMALTMAGPDERMWQSIKAKQKDKVMDAGPLFTGIIEDEKPKFVGSDGVARARKEPMPNWQDTE